MDSEWVRILGSYTLGASKEQLCVRREQMIFAVIQMKIRISGNNYRLERMRQNIEIDISDYRHKTVRVDLSPRLGDTQWPMNPPLLSSSHSPSLSPVSYTHLTLPTILRV